MGYFVKLRHINGKDILVNFDNVVYVTPHSDPSEITKVLLYFSTAEKDFIAVEGSLEGVRQLIAATQQR